MTRRIDYANLMHDAMRHLIQTVLEDVAQHGLPGDHHFFITFSTLHPDVEIADWLSDRYPEEMTIVLQHWFDGLDVTEEGFSVTLNFGNAPEPLYIPWASLRTFVDPSVEFGLRFDTPSDAEPLHSVEDETPDAAPDPDPQIDTETDTEEPAREAEVVSLDAFRKP